MDKNKLIMLILVIIIAILAAGLVMSNMHSFEKKQTKLTITGNSSISKGDSIKVKLTDLNDTPIANQTVNITVTGKDNTSEYFSVVTNDKGVGKLKMDKDAGSYKINCTYGGNDKYAGNSSSKKLTIKEKAAETESGSSSSDSGSSSQRYVKDDLGGTYDTYTGRYVGGQHDGSTKEQVEEYNRGIYEEQENYKRTHRLNK